jgi:hypothetical protein
MTPAAIRVLALDVNKGREEGREEEKVLSWFPKDKRAGPFLVRCAGFLEGLLGFACSVFSDEEWNGPRFVIGRLFPFGS